MARTGDQLKKGGSQTARFAAIFAGGTFISRVLGLVRDAVIGSMVAPAARDAFLVAFRLPNMLRDLVGEGATNAAFVPVFSETLEKESDAAFHDLVRASMGAMIIVLGVLSVLGVLIVPAMLDGIGALKGITGGEPITEAYVESLVILGRWLFPYLFFIGLAVFAMGVLFSVGHYSTPSWSPALLNVALIACCALFYPRFSEPIYALVLGVWLGGIAQTLVNYIALVRATGIWSPSFNFRHPKLFTIAALLGPVVAGQAAGEVNKLVDAMFAAALADGSVTALYYANRLVQLPLAMFGLAVAAAMLPSASRSFARQKKGEVRALLMQGYRQCFFLIVPAAVGLAVLGTPIVRLLFERGEFSPSDTSRTVAALAILAAGLVAFAGVRVGVTGFYAAKDTKTPVKISAFSMLLNIVLNVVLVGPLGFQGLALGTSISFGVNFVLIYLLLGRRYGPLWDAAYVTALIRICAATAVSCSLAYVTYTRLGVMIDADNLTARALLAGLPMLVATGGYFFLCSVLGVEELNVFVRAIAGRIRRKRV